MMKGNDRYVPRVTHFPKRETTSTIAASAEKPKTTQKIGQVGANPRYGPKPKKRIIVTDEGDDGERQPEPKKAAKLEKLTVTPMRAKVKPMPKITNFRTLEKDTIPERFKMGQCRTSAHFHQQRCVTEFEKLNRIGEGTYGIVYRARDVRDGQIVALKRVRMEKERDGMPISSIREISILFSLKHVNIVELKTVAVGQQLDSLFLVMSYCHYDLASLLDHMERPFTEEQIKCLLIQVLTGLAYCHEKFIVHRDLKVSNLLMTDQGILKIADFGLSRSLGIPRAPSTPKVVTLWYRAPEVLFGSRVHTSAMDLWSGGCVLAELLGHQALFPARTEIELCDEIINAIGSPNENIWPGYSQLPFFKNYNCKNQPFNNLKQKFPYLTESGHRLLNQMLCYNPEKRVTATEALKHPYFNERPLPIEARQMPTFPEYRNTRRQTDRKESRKEQLKDDTKRHNTTQPGGGGVALPISVTLDS